MGSPNIMLITAVKLRCCDGPSRRRRPTAAAGAHPLPEPGHVAVAKMPIPGMGWLAYAKDTEGNIFGMMQPDPSAA